MKDFLFQQKVLWNILEKITDGNTKRYFAYSACKGTNDNSWEDAGYRFEEIDQVAEVYPTEVTTINYFYNNGKKVS